MSIFSSILNKIFHPASAAESSAAAAPEQGTSTIVGAAPGATVSAGQVSGQTVDVEAVLSGMASQKGGGGNWKTSVVDLLKLLDLDSSLDARKELASELNVHVGADGSAEQNIALSKAVWQQLAQNGGKVPDSLKN